MAQIGYSLVDGNGAEVQFWGDIPGQCAGVPNPLMLPNGGDHVHGVSGPCQLGDYHLVERHYAWGDEAPAAFDGTRVVVTGALATLKAQLKTRVDEDAETVRLRYITPGPGQAMTYQEKFAQAQEVHDMGEEAANAMPLEQAAQDLPVLAAGIGIDAPTLWGCSQIVIQMAEQWSTVAGAIERVRLQGKKSISDASDAAAAQAAYEAITWPNP